MPRGITWSFTVGLESSTATMTFVPTSESAVGVEEATDTIAPEALAGLLSNLSRIPAFFPITDHSDEWCGHL